MAAVWVDFVRHGEAANAFHMPNPSLRTLLESLACETDSSFVQSNVKTDEWPSSVKV